MSRASAKRPLKEVGINGKVGGNCQRISFNGGTATDNRREMNDHIELGVIFGKEVTDIAPILYVNASDLVVLRIKMLLEVSADKAFIACYQDFHFPHLSLSYL